MKRRPRQHRPSKGKATSTRKPDPLPTEVEDLQAMVMELLHEVAQLKRMLFGRRSEKVYDDPNQGLLFGGVEPQPRGTGVGSSVCVGHWMIYP